MAYGICCQGKNVIPCIYCPIRIVIDSFSTLKMPLTDSVIGLQWLFPTDEYPVFSSPILLHTSNKHNTFQKNHRQILSLSFYPFRRTQPVFHERNGQRRIRC